MSLSHLVELVATFTECLLVLITTISVSKKRFNTSLNLLLIIIFSLISMTIVDLLNQWREFSYITPLAAMISIIFIGSWVLSTGSILIRSSSCILAYLIIQCIDYIIIVLCGHLIGNPANFFAGFHSSILLNIITH